MAVHYPNSVIAPGSAKEPTATSYTMRYRRPEAPWSVGRMVVPDGAEAAALQKARLEALGYSVIDVTPPLPPLTAKL
jgi:hypothetical protein